MKNGYRQIKYPMLETGNEEVANVSGVVVPSNGKGSFDKSWH
jgi:hypothetical protein